MAAGRNIKGITIEIGGDSTKLQKALSDVNGQIRTTQAQLKDVDKLLKFDPGNTELLAQRHRLLGDAVNETKDKLQTLKDAAVQANDALAKGDMSRDKYDALQREIAETEQALKTLEDQAGKAGTAVASIAGKGENLKKVGGNISGVGEKMLPATAAVAGLGAAAVKVAADFDSGMSKVAAISGAAGDDLQSLRDKAMEMGNKTQFSATEAASAMEYMAMAGWKTEDMLGGIEGIMDLAAASGEDLASTSDIVTDALTAFGMSADESGHFADILAVASANANTNVSMMGETFKYCAPIAGSFGFSAEDTAEAIGLMGNAGIKASQAGTSLRSIMNIMSGPIDIVGDKLGEVTIATTNADGTMRDLSDILADCRGAFSQLSESEKATVAQSLVGKNAMSGFLALMNAGQGDIDKISSSIANCDGAAKDMANTMNDNLSAQMGILKGQMETLGISFGEMLVPLLRDLVGIIQGVVDKLNGLSEGQRKVILIIAGVVAAIGPVLIIIGSIISAVGTIMTIVPQITAAIGMVKGAVAAFNAVLLANPIGIVIAVIVALVAAFIYLWNNCEEFRNFWINLWEMIKTAASTAWEAITSFISNAWQSITTVAGSIANTVGSIVTTIVSGFNNAVSFVRNLAGQAFSWGYDLIMGIANGIRNAIGQVRSAVTSVANAIKRRLHFSVPEEGPLTDYESWMPDFMGGLAESIEKSRGMVRDAISHVSEDMQISPNASAATTMMINASAGRNDNGTLLSMLAQYLPYIPEIANSQMVTETGTVLGWLTPLINSQLGVIASRQKRQG